MIDEEVIKNLTERQLLPFRDNAEEISNTIQIILQNNDFEPSAVNMLCTYVSLMQKQFSRIQSIVGHIREISKATKEIDNMSRCDNKGDDNA